MMCLSILFSNNKNTLNNRIVENKKEKKDEIPESTDINDDNFEDNSFYEEYKEIDEKKESKNNIEKMDDKKIINGMKYFKEAHYLFGNHYYKNRNKIYCFKPRKNKNNVYKTFYCYKRYKGCNALCIVDKKNDTVRIIGNHNHYDTFSQMIFNNKFPNLIKKKWKHIQIFKVNNKDIIVRQS